MRAQPHLKVILGLLSMGLVASCVTRADIEEIKKNQKDILTKLDTVKAAPARPTPQRPKGPDPSKVYAFPTGDSPAMGKKDAWVTVIEVSDFQ